MSIFDKQRLAEEVFKIEADKIRRGWYSDKYFANNVLILETLAKEKYTFQGESDIQSQVDCSAVGNGDIIVEMQFFTRRKPLSLVVGVDEALAILKVCSGYFDENGIFINMYSELEVEAVQDGTFVYYNGNPLEVQPVLKIRGNYRYFAKLETVLLGVLAEPTRVATNVFNVLVASRRKEVLFFPARFTHYKMQALHGYAYSLAIQAFNQKYGGKKGRFVSTDGQGDYWGAEGVGTIAHATICTFFGDTVETMMQFSRILPNDVARIALIDYHNDCIGESRKVMTRMFKKYLELIKGGNIEEASKYKLYAVRPDTSGNMRDKSIVPTGDKALDMGVSIKLVWNLREGIDKAYEEWSLSGEDLIIAKKWCEEVKICVTGGFNVKKISEFEEQGVPVDIYGVGSTFLENSNETNNDFTADIVRVNIKEKWYHLSKIGRCACDNIELELI
jgi:nicotinate phosphoribosyltransferase